MHFENSIGKLKHENLKPHQTTKTSTHSYLCNPTKLHLDVFHIPLHFNQKNRIHYQTQKKLNQKMLFHSSNQVRNF